MLHISHLSWILFPSGWTPVKAPHFTWMFLERFLQYLSEVMLNFARSVMLCPWIQWSYSYSDILVCLRRLQHYQFCDIHEFYACVAYVWLPAGLPGHIRRRRRERGWKWLSQSIRTSAASRSADRPRPPSWRAHSWSQSRTRGFL